MRRVTDYPSTLLFILDQASGNDTELMSDPHYGDRRNSDNPSVYAKCARRVVCPGCRWRVPAGYVDAKQADSSQGYQKGRPTA